MEKIIVFLALALAISGIAHSQLDSWNTITYIPRGSTQQVTARVVKAPESLECPMDPNTPCELTLNVSSMLTMTLYPYNSSQTEEYAGGWRNSKGKAAKVNPDGSFGFRYDNANPKAYEEYLWPITGDGTRRSVLVVNNRMPGPTIVTRLGQELKVTVINSLFSESISIHWHGLHQRGTPWMDGVPMITQCPILPNTNFTYKFTPTEVGTHWYHSHSGAQRTDGLFGVLVVTSPDEFEGTDVNPGDFEDLPGQHAFTVIDYQHVQSVHLIVGIRSSSGFDNLVEDSNSYRTSQVASGAGTAIFPFLSGLVSTAGWFFQPQNNASCMPVDNIPLTFFEVERGKAHRFRLVGAQNTYSFRLSVQGHKLVMLATDGVPTRSNPEEVDFITIHTGESYDFLLNATVDSDPDGHYWLIAETLETAEHLQDRGIQCLRGHRSYAIVKYSDATDLTTWPPDIDYDPTVDRNCYSDNSCIALNCLFRNYPPGYNITCVNVEAFQLRRPIAIPNNDVSESVFLNFGFVTMGSAINGRHFSSPPSPPVTQPEDLQLAGNAPDICEYTQEANPPGRVCTHMYKTNTETVEMVFMNMFPSTSRIYFTEAHVIHLHGHYFRVLHIGYGDCTSHLPTATCSHEEITCGYPDRRCNSQVAWTDGKLPAKVNISNNFAPLKDTVVVPSGAYVVLRFEANNPGWWFLHCHYLQHALEGMEMVVAEDVDNIPPPPSTIPRCGNFPIEARTTGGSGSPPNTDNLQQGVYFPLFVAFLVTSVVLLVAVIVLIVCLILCCIREDGCCERKASREEEVEMKDKKLQELQ